MAIVRRSFILGLTGAAISACDHAVTPEARAEFIAHPDNRTAFIEYFVSRPTKNGPTPLVVLLHGHQAGVLTPGGRAFVDWGELDRLAAMGFLAASVSLPGFGQSTGPADFAGSFTQAAIACVVTQLQRSRELAPGKIVLLGISLGAVASALLAARDVRISGLVLISGAYDLAALFASAERKGAADVRAQFERQTGGGDAALRSRSALFEAARIQARTLILNGAQDDRTDPAQGQQFSAALVRAGRQAECVIYPNAGHSIPVDVRRPKVDAFLRTFLG